MSKPLLNKEITKRIVGNKVNSPKVASVNLTTFALSDKNTLVVYVVTKANESHWVWYGFDGGSKIRVAIINRHVENTRNFQIYPPAPT